MSQGFVELEPWLSGHGTELSSAGIGIEFARSPAGRDPASLSVDFNTPTVAARIAVWSDGQGQLAVLDLSKKEELLDEYVPNVDQIGLDVLLNRLLRYLPRTQA